MKAVLLLCCCRCTIAFKQLLHGQSSVPHPLMPEVGSKAWVKLLLLCCRCSRPVKQLMHLQNMPVPYCRCSISQLRSGSMLEVP